MKSLTACPATLQPGFDTYSPAARKALFDGNTVSPILDFDLEKDYELPIVRGNMNNISISGAQEKYSAVVENGHIRLSHPNEQATHILKPAPINYSLSTRKQIPANEHLTMQIAAQIYGIHTAANALCFTPKGQPVYITRRFDVKPDNTNLKNFSLINRNGEYSLAPAYDLINTRIHLESSDLALRGGLAPDIEPSDTLLKTGHLCRLDFEHFAQRIGLPKKRAGKLMDLFMDIPSEAYLLINRSFLNDKMKRNYKRIIEQRRQWFLRDSLF